MEDEEAGLDPVPLSVVSPPDSGKEVDCLKGVLDDSTCPVVLDAPMLQGLDKRDTEEHCSHHTPVYQG